MSRLRYLFWSRLKREPGNHIKEGLLKRHHLGVIENAPFAHQGRSWSEGTQLVFDARGVLQTTRLTDCPNVRCEIAIWPPVSPLIFRITNDLSWILKGGYGDGGLSLVHHLMRPYEGLIVGLSGRIHRISRLAQASSKGFDDASCQLLKVSPSRIPQQRRLQPGARLRTRNTSQGVARRQLLSGSA